MKLRPCRSENERKNMAERNCDNRARGELKELLLFMLQGAVHLLTCAAGQALLWALII